MAATRLSDSQKTELVGRFREGSSSQELAETYGCSPNTVIRVVRTELGEEAYERVKSERSRRRSRPPMDGAAPPEALQTALAISSTDDSSLEAAPEPAAPAPPAPAPPALVFIPEPTEAFTPEEPEPELEPAPPRKVLPDPPRRLSVAAPVRAEAVAEDGPAVLAIEDADDFGADDDDLLTSDDDDSDDGADGEFNPFQVIPVVRLDDGAAAGGEGQLQPLVAAALPSSAYMLVDKTVELQARPLSEFPELGRLPDAELERQALVVFLNPRQAKRQCGRTQRVIKVPDLKVFELTAPYLLAQGISRVVIEGALYALPGS
ncbi:MULTISPECIES: hypothetical protein [unclassified Cyanobium]|uniref:hypothetical protein n=1 Tax=unclassified Cyanobium TaxID=2627006 RepID=UPI0020CE9E04|nr:MULTISPECIES: hypothetical protein [unclassified Cyanobium]MCP9835584.1 hypothetical protein [Cyanobium sp. La Preciosa 7G6]MCP9938335.1 hypothetical protein [Cyanobium sp. Aljojuca 7A6]